MTEQRVMGERKGNRRWELGCLAVFLVGGAIGGWWLYSGGRGTPPEEHFPLPAFSSSPYLNTKPDVAFIGTAACAECHRGQHQSYLHTAHSKALSDVDPNAEPPDGTFEHKPSGRLYRVYRQDGELRHEEMVRSEDGKEICRTDLPMKYLVGSGNYARAYLVEVDGFLHQSPITWYPSRQAWGMSPGYDFPDHFNFTRPVTAGCMVCHAGRVESVGAAVHRLTFPEKTIGCESCHGPGGLHQELHRKGKRSTDGDDFTIVHPGKLSRPLLEDICATCHLSAQATVYVRGREVGQFRPGMPQRDYAIHYGFKEGNEQMTVVGHMEQLRMSVCYQKSEMTCLTCHDPHLRTPPTDWVAYNRKKCLSCHEAQGCTVPVAERVKKQPADDCTACHMPRGDTEIPHIAFTHHRVGRHGAPERAETGLTPEIVAIESVAHLSAVDQQRNLGIANLEAAREHRSQAHAEVFRERARKLLEGVRAAGLRDAEATQALAELYAETDLPRAAGYAREVRASRDGAPAVRVGALMVLAYHELGERRFAAAAELLEQVVQLRRYAEDWWLLGAAYLEQGQPAKALPALRQALAIRPARPQTHESLATAYRQVGDNQRASEHAAKARWLTQHQRN